MISVLDYDVGDHIEKLYNEPPEPICVGRNVFYVFGEHVPVNTRHSVLSVRIWWYEIPRRVRLNTLFGR